MKVGCALSLPFACGGPTLRRILLLLLSVARMCLTTRFLGRVIVASREDSYLDVQLSKAKAFTLPVFRAEAKNSGRKASSAQGSSASSAFTSGFRGRGRGSDSGGSKHKASSPGSSRSKKSPRCGSSPASKQGGGRK